MDDFLERYDPKIIMLMIVFIVILLSAIQVMYIVLPEYKNYKKYNVSHQVLKSVAGNEMGLEQQLEQMKTEVNKLHYKLHGGASGLPEEQMESYIIGRLQKISWASDVELASIIPKEGNQVQIFQETLFNVKINATYFNFFNWLQSINNELGYVIIQKFEIHPKTGKEDNDPELNISLTLVTYRMAKK